MTTGEQVIIVVDGAAGESGSFTLNIGVPSAASEAGLCADGVDNDGTGGQDCNDAGCTGDPWCAATCAGQPSVGSATGPAVATGNTGTGADLLSGSCGGAGAPEHACAFTAAVAGSYTFDTLGSSLDTILYVLDGNCGNELGCNDNQVPSLQSSVTRTLREGQTVVVVIDGFGTASGDYVLNITDP
jgi:hypothetical protein